MFVASCQNVVSTSQIIMLLEPPCKILAIYANIASFYDHALKYYMCYHMQILVLDDELLKSYTLAEIERLLQGHGKNKKVCCKAMEKICRFSAIVLLLPCPSNYIMCV